MTVSTPDSSGTSRMVISNVLKELCVEIFSCEISFTSEVLEDISGGENVG